MPREAIELVMLSSGDLQPNDWNPNEMGQEEFAQFVEAVRRRRQLPKPLVVVKEATGYRIIDGEHGYRAALQAGLPEVPCQVLELDRFEQIVETHQRNIHGRANPVLQGRMFERMRQCRDLSNRELAQRIGISEGSIRNYMLYSQATEVRSRYAAPKGHAEKETIKEIAALPLQAVRAYLEMPGEVRDAWLDGGGSVDGTVSDRPSPSQQQKSTEPQKAKSWTRKAREARDSCRKPGSGERGKGRDRLAPTSSGGLEEAGDSTAGASLLSAGPDVSPATGDPAQSAEGECEEELTGLLDRLHGYLDAASPDGIRRLVRSLLARAEIARAVESELAAAG